MSSSIQIHTAALRIACWLAISAVAGCSDTSLNSMLSGPATSVKTVAVVKDGVPSEPMFVVSLAPVLGPPPAFIDALMQGLNTAANAHNIALLIDKDAKGDYLLRGNFVVSRGKATVSLAYNWDILDRTGARVTRVTNEETQASPGVAASPWADVSAATVQTVAEKAMASLAALGKPVK